MLNLALFQPQIAPNTGNIMRLVANNGFYLHLIKPYGFNIEEKRLRRAGLDYSDLDKLCEHASFEQFYQSINPQRLFAITTKGTCRYTDVAFQAGDTLLFGSETAGLPATVHARLPDSQRLRIPMQPNNRSLNLSNAAAIVSYEAWRQLGFNQG